MKSFEISSKVEPGDPWAIFTCNHPIGLEETISFISVEQSRNAPLVQQLFYLPFVKSVKIRLNEIHIERFDILEWHEVESEICQQIEDYLNDGGIVIKNDDIVNSSAPITIYAESTPNPKAMKFVANKPLFEHTLEFKSVDQAINVPLVQKLFNFSYIQEVFIDSNYISIQSKEDWNQNFMEIREFIRDYLQTNQPIISGDLLDEVILSNKHQANLTQIEKQIVEVLDNYVRPAVAADGGNIAFDSYDKEKKILSLILQGACSGCPSSTFTLKMGIENMMKQMLPDKVDQVVAING